MKTSLNDFFKKQNLTDFFYFCVDTLLSNEHTQQKMSMH